MDRLVDGSPWLVCTMPLSADHITIGKTSIVGIALICQGMTLLLLIEICSYLSQLLNPKLKIQIKMSLTHTWDILGVSILHMKNTLPQGKVQTECSSPILVTYLYSEAFRLKVCGFHSVVRWL